MFHVKQLKIRVMRLYEVENLHRQAEKVIVKLILTDIDTIEFLKMHEKVKKQGMHLFTNYYFAKEYSLLFKKLIKPLLTNTNN